MDVKLPVQKALHHQPQSCKNENKYCLGEIVTINGLAVIFITQDGLYNITN